MADQIENSDKSGEGQISKANFDGGQVLAQAETLDLKSTTMSDKTAGQFPSPSDVGSLSTGWAMNSGDNLAKVAQQYKGTFDKTKTQIAMLIV